MRLKSELQTKIAPKAQIEDLLIQLKEIGFSDLPELGRKLGYARNPFSKLNTDENYSGSTQLVASLELFLELEKLKQDREKGVKIEHLERLLRETLDCLVDYKKFKELQKHFSSVAAANDLAKLRSSLDEKTRNLLDGLI